jgi:hypothetical protein
MISNSSENRPTYLPLGLLEDEENESDGRIGEHLHRCSNSISQHCEFGCHAPQATGWAV